MASLNEYPSLMAELLQRYQATIVIESLIFLLLLLLSLLGNSLVCFVLTKNTRLKTTPNMLVANLAAADIMMSGLCMPLSLGVAITGRWEYGPVVCDAQGFLIFSFGIVSVWTMCLIAINRYVAISRPFLYTKIFTAQKLRVLIIFLWLLPALASVPPLVGWGYYAFQPGKSLCIYPFSVNMAYTFLVQCLFIATPMTLIIYSYVKCYKAMRANNRRVAAMTTGAGDQVETRRKAQEARATRMMMAATAGFLMCWGPVSVIDFVDAFTGGHVIPRQVFMLNAYLIYISSTINPFIYWAMNKDFRRAFNEVVPCLKLLRRESSEASPSVVGAPGSTAAVHETAAKTIDESSLNTNDGTAIRMKEINTVE